MECCKSPSASTRCRVMVQMSRPACGHKVDIECSKKASINKTKCSKLTQQQLNCGHDRFVECSKSVDQRSCQKKCSAILPCGHHCEGKCRNCSENMFHEPCKKSCNKILICGHSCNNAKCGLCRPCNNQCNNYCPHRKCKHTCGSECRPCHEKCSLACPHHQCSRLCFEPCDRPRCDRPCPLLLNCQHQCLGFCGDPCPDSCIKCDTKRIQKVFCRKPPSEDSRLVRLVDCGHEFDSNYLDEIMEGKTNTLDILRCPKCKEIVRWHPRYANLLKVHKKATDSVKKVLSLQGCLPRISFPKETDNIAKAAMYIARFRTYLYIKEKLHHVTSDVGFLNQWAISFTEMFTKLLKSSQNTVELTLPQVHSINRNMCKLSAVWILLISSHWENRSSSSDFKVDTKTSGQISDGKRMENVEQKQKTINDAESFIRKAHTFTPSDMQKVRKMLELFLSNASEAVIAFDFPVLVAVGVHRDDWTTCDKGHFRPSNIWSKACSECSSENLIKQYGLDVGGACGGDGCERDQGGGQGRGSGRGRSNEGSLRDRGRGLRGQGKGRELERTCGKDCKQMEESVKRDVQGNSGLIREKCDQKTGRECCGEIVERHKKMRDGDVQQSNKINEKVTNGENRKGRDKGETGVGSKVKYSRGSGKGDKKGRGKETGKELGKRSEEQHGRKSAEQHDRGRKGLRENVAGREKGLDRGRENNSGGKGGRKQEKCEESKGCRDGNIKEMSGREFEGAPSRGGHDGKSRGGKSGDRGGARGGDQRKSSEKNEGRQNKEHSEESGECTYSGHRGGRGRGSERWRGRGSGGGRGRGSGGGRGRGSVSVSALEDEKINKAGSYVCDGVKHSGGSGRGRGRGSKRGRGRGSKAGHCEGSG